MSADLQEPPELFLEIFGALKAGADVALGVRRARHDSFWKRFSSGVFWAFYRRFVQPKMPEGGIDIFGCARNVRDAVLSIRGGEHDFGRPVART
jgi:hypothetical protein